MFKKTVPVLAIAASVASVFVSSQALATSCTPTLVSATSPGTIQLTCGGTVYYASYLSCSNSWDSLKQFFSVAEAALLAGKSLNIATSTSNGCANHLIFMELVK